jgi:hypothetical protein
MDRGLLEFFGPFGLSSQIYGFTRGATSATLGFLFHTLFLLLISLLFVLLIAGNWSFLAPVVDERVGFFVVFVFLLSAYRQ